MIWRIGGRSYKALRTAYRHKLYALGICTWVLTIGLIAAGIRWDPARSETDKIIAAQPAADQPAQVLGESADQDWPKAPANTSTNPPDTSPSPATHRPKSVLSRQTPSIVPASAPSAPEQPPASTQSGNMPAVDTQPSIPAEPTDTSKCTTDPSGVSTVTLASSWTVPAGGQTSQEIITISDTSKLIWQTMDRMVFMGEVPNPATPVFMAVSSPAGTAPGPSISYHIQALETATPGTVVDFSWRIEDGVQGICQNVTVQVTVVAPEPVVAAI